MEDRLVLAKDRIPYLQYYGLYTSSQDFILTLYGVTHLNINGLKISDDFQIDEEDSDEDSDVLSGLSKNVVLQKCRDMARTRLNERRTTLRSAVAPGMNVTVDRPKTKKVSLSSMIHQSMSRTTVHRGKRSTVTSAATSVTDTRQAGFLKYSSGTPF